MEDLAATPGSRVPPEGPPIPVPLGPAEKAGTGRQGRAKVAEVPQPGQQGRVERAGSPRQGVQERPPKTMGAPTLLPKLATTQGRPKVVQMGTPQTQVLRS